MTTVFVAPLPPFIEEYLEERRRRGLDGRDEVWAGVLHVAPITDSRHGSLTEQVGVALFARARQVGLWPAGSFNLGEPDDHRIPDRGYRRERYDVLFVPTAALVVEVLSPGDETYAKFAFYAAHGVEEILVVDPGTSSLQWWGREDDGFAERPGSLLLHVSAETLTAEIDWP